MWVFLARRFINGITDATVEDKETKKSLKAITRVLGVVATVATFDVASGLIDGADLVSSFADGAGSLADAAGSAAHGFGFGGTSDTDIYYQDVRGDGYKTEADYQAGTDKMEKASDGQWYPRGY